MAVHVLYYQLKHRDEKLKNHLNVNRIMALKQTIDEVLSTEIKRDIAERYFSFRKLIEEDEMDLEEKIRQYSIILEKRISFDLIRIYILLKKEKFINTFLKLAGLDNKLFYDPYLTESATIAARVFRCQRFSGFTKAGRFSNFLFECYVNLYYHTEIYHRHIDELVEERGLIAEEIKQFYNENDLSSILGFIHSLGNEEVCSCIQSGPETGLADELARKMKIPPLPPIEKTLTILPQLAEPDEIKQDLKKLAQKAYREQQTEFLKMFDQKRSPCDRLGM